MTNSLLHTAVLLMFVAQTNLEKTGTVSFEARLVKYLTSNITDYSPILMPKLNTSENFTVTIDVMLSHVVAVEPAKQSIIVSLYVEVKWDEERLVWNPNDFGNVTTVSWATNSIWMPSIIVYNGFGDRQLRLTPLTLCSVTENRSHVTATSHQEIGFFCTFHMTAFPFDEHNCELLFYLGDERFYYATFVQSNEGRLNLTGIYKAHSEWSLINVSTYAEPRFYYIIENQEPLSLNMFVFNVAIRRIDTYYMVTVTVPLLLLTLVQAITYFVPVESGEKLGFGITIMLSYTVFLLLLDSILPKSPSMPVVALFIAAAMVMSTVSLILTTIIMRMHNLASGTCQMSACTRAVLVKFLGRLLRISEASPSTTVIYIGQSPSKPTGGDNSGGQNKQNSSDWSIAIRAMERLMSIIGVLIALAVVAGLIANFIYH